MAKLLFNLSILAAALALAGCSNDDMPTGKQQKYITIKTEGIKGFGESETRTWTFQEFSISTLETR